MPRRIAHTPLLVALIGLPVVFTVAGGVAVTVLCSDRVASRALERGFTDRSYVLVLQNGIPHLISGSAVTPLPTQQPGRSFGFPSKDISAINAALQGRDKAAYPEAGVSGRVVLLPSPHGVQRIQTQVWSKNRATFTTYSIDSGVVIPERVKSFGIGQAIQGGQVACLAALGWLVSCAVVARRTSAAGA